MPGVNTVTAAIARAGHPEVELVRGDGYHYYVLDSYRVDTAKVLPLVYETESVMCCRFDHRPHDKWVADGIAFAERVKRERGL